MKIPTKYLRRLGQIGKRDTSTEIKSTGAKSVVLLFGLLVTGLVQAQLPQGLPDAAKPQAQIPKDTFLYLELEPEPGKYIIPPVVDRPLETTGGPRIKIGALELRGVNDYPDQNLKVDDIWTIVEQEQSLRPDGMTIGELQGLANQITDYYLSRGFVVAHAFLPVQTVEDGVVTIQVLEGVLGRVLVEGHQHYTPEQIAQPFSGLLGRPLIGDELESALVRLSDYPGLTAFAVLQPGEAVARSDVVLKVQKEKGGDLTYSLDNYGSRFTGEYVSRFDLTVNRMFGEPGQLQLTYQRSMDPTLSDYLSFEYERQLFRPRFRFAFGQQDSDFALHSQSVGIVGVTGQSRVLYARLRDNFRRGRLSNAYWMVSINSKTSKTYQHEVLLAQDDLTVLSFEYGLDFLDAESQSFNNLVVQVHHGLPNRLGSMDAFNDQGASRRLQSGDFIGARFDKLNITYARLQTLSPSRTVLFRAAYQDTSNPLPGLEQFSMGGPDNVRAFSGSEFTVDRGIFVSGEYIFNAPGFADRPSPFGNRKWGQVFSVSLFADWAHGERIENLVSEDRYESIKGVGIGAQLDVPDAFTASLTTAWPVMNTDPPGNKRRPQVFFSFETDLF